MTIVDVRAGLVSAKPMEQSALEAPLHVFRALKDLGTQRGGAESTPTPPQPAGREGGGPSGPGGPDVGARGPGGPPGAGGGDGGGGGGGGGGGAGRGTGPDLTDLRLPDDLAGLFAPLLGEYAMTLKPTELPNKVIKTHRLHQAVNGGYSFYLLHFPHEVLEDANYAQTVMLRAFLFNRGNRVRIVSRDCQDVAAAIEFGLQEWKRQEIDTAIVEWRRIARLAKEPADERADLLHLALGLPETVKKRAATLDATSLLDDAPMTTALRAIIVSAGTTSGTNDTSAFISARLLRATLPEAFRNQRAVWPNNYPDAAVQLITWLHGIGTVPGSKEGYTALGLVLVSFLGERGLGDRRVIYEALRRYSLITDVTELERLRAEWPDE